MRCPNCNRFVSTELNEEPDVEVNTIEDLGKGKGLVTLTLRMSTVCIECGEELAEKEIEVQAELDLTAFEPLN